MSYISTGRKGNKILVWERTPEGRKIKKYDAPLYFFVKDDAGQYTSIFGEKLRKIEFADANDLYLRKKLLNEKGVKTYEGDVSPELKILSKHYHGKTPPKLNITFYDIEVDYDLKLGFSSVENPYAPINSISLYNVWENKYTLLAVPPKGQNWSVEQLEEAVNEKVPLPDDINISFKLFNSESSLLETVLNEIKDTDLISAWNGSKFDDPYIATRIKKIIGISGLKKLSFTGAKTPSFREIKESFGGTAITVDFHGRINCDYLELYKKYDPTEKQSFKLEYIAEEEVGDQLPKLDYDGSLADLYVKDFAYFVRYNIRDTEILKAFEEKLGYVGLANEICHLSCCHWKDIYGTVKIGEIVMGDFCRHELDVILPDNKYTKQTKRAKGAYVLNTIAGLYDWIGSIDLTSLYPRSIMSINASPETLRGQFVETTKAVELIKAESNEELKLILEENNTSKILTAKEWKRELLKLNWSISGYGTVFDLNTQGVIPRILEDWFDMRSNYKQKMNTSYNEAQKILNKYK